MIRVYKINSILEETNAKLTSQLKDKGMYINVIQEQKKELKEKVDLLTKEIEKMENTGSTSTIADIPNSSTNNMNTDSSNISSSDISEILVNEQIITLSKGTYTVGIDIQPGTYDLLTDSGFGLLTGDLSSGFISEAIGISERYPNNKTYSGLELTNGDEFRIKSSVTIKFIPR